MSDKKTKKSTIHQASGLLGLAALMSGACFVATELTAGAIPESVLAIVAAKTITAVAIVAAASAYTYKEFGKKEAVAVLKTGAVAGVGGALLSSVYPLAPNPYLAALLTPAIIGGAAVVINAKTRDENKLLVSTNAKLPKPSFVESLMLKNSKRAR